MNIWGSHSSNDRNNCYMKTNKFYQICAFHGEVNTFCHFAKIVLKNLCYFAFVWSVPYSYILYLQNIRDFVNFDRIQKGRLIIKFSYKYKLCTFLSYNLEWFQHIMIGFSKISWIHELCKVLTAETNVTSKQINSIIFVRFTVR